MRPPDPEHFNAPMEYRGGPVAWEGGPDHVSPWIKEQGRLMRERDRRVLASPGTSRTFVDMWRGLDAATKARVRADYWNSEDGAWKPGTPDLVRRDGPPGTLMEG